MPQVNPAIKTRYINPRIQLHVEDVLNRFTYHAPHGDQPLRYEEIRAAALKFAELIVYLCPSSRERSTALTHLDAVVFNANAAIARNEKKEGGS